MPLEQYRKKRDFSRTPEPPGADRPRRGEKRQEAQTLEFVVQKHAASRLHYDFRLEMDGVLKSWAVPKGPSLDPGEKRLAVEVEDHPIEYGGFEGAIPEGQYGGGTVQLWDRGTWESLEGEPLAAWQKGKLKIELHGEKMRGGWTLVRMHGARAGERRENWLLIKENDATARPGSGDALVREKARSVESGQTIEEIASDPQRIWDARHEEGPGARPSPAAAAAGLKDAARALPGARRHALPQPLQCALATPVTEPPVGGDWVHEIKLDGYRAFAELRHGKARMITRAGKDWSERFSPIAAAVAALPVESAVLDGEVTVLLPDGMTSFEALQEALGDARRGGDLVYFAFDLLYLDGYDIRAAPLIARKELLRALLLAAGARAGEGPLRWSDHVTGQGADFLKHACDFGLEGIISKRADQPYRGGRSQLWLKVKCRQRQEMVIGGFTDPAGTRTALGALLLGVYEDGAGDRGDENGKGAAGGKGGRLLYSGRAGTGFTESLLVDLHRRLARLERPAPPFANPPRGAEARGVHWVEPQLVAEVEFANWTHDGILRQASFVGLREDKPAREVRRERPKAPPAGTEGRRVRGDRAGVERSGNVAVESGKPEGAGTGARRRTVAERKAEVAKSAAARRGGPAGTAGASGAGGAGGGRAGTGRGAGTEVAGVRLTHPEKVLFPDSGITKLDLALHYERIAGWVLPHLAHRPLTLVRCPDGQGGECFYQKHMTDQFPDAVQRVKIEEGGKTVLYPSVDSAAGLVALVQMGVLEIHTWGSHDDQPERPDYVVFDLDPDEGLPWDRVVEAALGMRAVLADIGLRSFLKTTGGKGLHVVFPLQRRHTWEEVKGFTRAIAEAIAAAQPDRYTANALKAHRKGRIYIDYLRNARGATSIAAYSCRSRPGAPVSTPLAWDELSKDVRGTAFNVQNLSERLDQLQGDPWREMAKARQSLTAAMKRRFGLPA